MSNSYKFYSDTKDIMKKYVNATEGAIIYGISKSKEKAKIHAHEPKGAKIKGSNIYTVERGPKTIGAKVSDDKKKSYRKSTIHQSESKNKGLSRFKRNYRESNTSIKTTGYDLGELVYVDYEGMEENPSNYYDIMAVYMVNRCGGRANLH